MPNSHPPHPRYSRMLAIRRQSVNTFSHLKVTFNVARGAGSEQPFEAWLQPPGKTKTCRVDFGLRPSSSLLHMATPWSVPRYETPFGPLLGIGGFFVDEIK